MWHSSFVGRQQLYGVVWLEACRKRIVLLDENSQIVEQVEIGDCIGKTISNLARFKSILSGIAVTTVTTHIGLIENLVDAGFRVHLVTLSDEKSVDLLKENDLSFARKLAKRLQNKICYRKCLQMPIHWPHQLRLNHARR